MQQEAMCRFKWLKVNLVQCVKWYIGRPQSSIIEPLLFLIYINDLPEICDGEDPSYEIFLYADDSKIYKVIRNQSVQQKLQSILNLIKKLV